VGNAIVTETGEILCGKQTDSYIPAEGKNGGHLHTRAGLGASAVPEEKLSKIFESFTQADSSTTRKYGARFGPYHQHHLQS